MELRYTLTPDDLRAALRMLYVARVLELRKSRLVNALIVAAAGLLVWPLSSAALRELLGPAVAIGLHAALVLVAAAVWFAVRRLLPPVGIPGLADWTARRQLTLALERSVLGPVTVRVTEAALVRVNEQDELVIPWADVTGLLAAEDHVLVRLKPRRVVIAPTRAFSSAQEAAAFRALLIERSGHALVELPPGAAKA